MTEPTESNDGGKEMEPDNGGKKERGEGKNGRGIIIMEENNEGCREQALHLRVGLCR